MRGRRAACVSALIVVALAVSTASISTASAASTPTPTTVTLTVSPSSPQVVNQSVLFNVAISPTNAFGTLSLYDGSTLLGATSNYQGWNASTSWSYTTSSLTVGSHSIKVTFTPQTPSAHAAATATFTDVISATANPTPPAPTPTKLTLTASPSSPQALNQPVLFNVAISPTNALGTVSLYDGSTLLGSTSNSQGWNASTSWSYTTSSLSVGSHSIKVVFTPQSPSTHAAATTTLTDVISASTVPSSPAPTPTPTPTPTSTSGGCDLSADLVPSCGVMFGAYPTSFGGANIDAEFNNFNSESGSTISIGHDYLRPGMTLSSGDVALAKTPGALLLVNWKPSNTWLSADGGDATVNAQIDAMAQSVKALGSTKIMMSIFHEPENDVSSGATNCPTTIYRGSAGTPAQYRAMWANVEARFAAQGVTNVVWSMNYMGYSAWNCMVDDLWPGNSLVDWVLWDPYQTTSLGFAASVTSFYGELTSLSDAAHDYLSKPWGLAEFGDNSSVDSNQEQFYSSVAKSLDSNQFPKLKLISLYDALGTGGDYRVAFDEAGNPDPKELANLALLSNDPLIVAGRASVNGG
jgi:hypothetical protein